MSAGLLFRLYRYYRKAKAQQLLSQTSAAIDTLIGALKRPTLAGEMGLSDLLVELFGGFPENVSPLIWHGLVHGMIEVTSRRRS